MKNIKNLRKTNNANLLIISSSIEICESIKNEFTGSFKEVIVANTGEEALLQIKSKKIDLTLLDTDITAPNFKNICFELDSKIPAIPKILITNDDKESTVIDAINCGAFMVVTKPINISHLKMSVIMCLNHTKRGDKLVFAEGIYYDEYRERFYKKNGEIIDLTKLEIGLLKFLIDKKSEIVDYDAINKHVWKGKKMSVFTMRNVVNKIRLKMYYDIIRNYSNKGYSIDAPKN